MHWLCLQYIILLFHLIFDQEAARLVIIIKTFFFLHVLPLT